MPAIYGVSVVVLAASLCVGCGKRADRAAVAEPVGVKVMTVGEGIQPNLGASYSGTVEEENGVALSFSVGGTIRQLCVKVGDRVRRGQLIASVDPTSAKNAYDMAHSTRLQADDAFRRMRQLHDKGSLPEIKWVEAQSQLQQAVSAEAIARKSLADCQLYAPMGGVIAEKSMEIGQNVAPGMPIARLVITQTLNVRISVPESEVAAIHVRQRARIRVEALSDSWIDGYVVEKGVVADPVTRSYSVKIRLTGSTAGLLPGMVSSVILGPVPTSASESVVIPSRLVQLADDNSCFVWVAEGGKAVRRTVVCGSYQSSGVTIENGLRRGDRIIVEGQQKVCSGTPVKSK